ncbi:M30 family zinc metallopeptidase [Salinispira pacifica]
MNRKVVGRSVSALLIAAAVLLTQGCAMFFDRQPPTPGGPIQFSSITDSSVTLSWPAALDGYTSSGDLTYQLYMSTNPSSIGNLAELGDRSAVTPVTAWTKGMTSRKVDGLTPGVTYYFNIVVQDSVHNTAAYNGVVARIATADFSTSSTPQTFDMSYGGGLALTITPGSNANVYAIITNAGTGSNPVPSVALAVEGTAARSLEAPASLPPRTYSTAGGTQAIVEPPQVVAFRRNPVPPAGGTLRGITPQASYMPPDYPPGAQRTFFDENNRPLTATLRKTYGTGTYRPRVLNLWVDDRYWSTDNSTQVLTNGMVNGNMLDSVEVAFENEMSTVGDIYRWETAIFGEPWGNDTGYSSLIGDNNAINILFTNMGSYPDGSYVVGFFYPRDNYVRTSGTGSVTDYSNQLLMFYMNNYAYGAGGEPVVISTLAHEFQHMIHFYQKTIKRAGGRGTDTWINEMMSLMTEDILSNYIASNVTPIDGPRGVDGRTSNAGSSGNQNGRLPEFNANDDISLSSWGAVNVLSSYAIAYSFGAFLERNFGGAMLLHEMMDNSYTDSRALTQTAAIQAANLQPAGMAGLLTRWAAAVLGSDTVVSSPPAGTYVYNTGTWFSSTATDLRLATTYTYRLGSINAFNYTWSSAPPPGYGPYIFPAGSAIVPAGGKQGPYSSQYVLLASGVSGQTIHRIINVGDNNYVTIIARNAP